MKLGVVIIDMQPRYLADITTDSRDGIVAGIGDLTTLCKKHNLPIAVIEYADSGKTITAVRNLIKPVPNRNRRVITKYHCSGFQGTTLDRFLKLRDVDTIVIVGVHASYCIRETAVAAIEAGYRVTTAPDLIADNSIASIKKMWSWYKENTTFYAHSAELCAIEIG